METLRSGSLAISINSTRWTASSDSVRVLCSERTGSAENDVRATLFGIGNFRLVARDRAVAELAMTTPIRSAVPIAMRLVFDELSQTVVTVGYGGPTLRDANRISWGGVRAAIAMNPLRCTESRI
jgi:hypothetical protein